MFKEKKTIKRIQLLKNSFENGIFLNSLRNDLEEYIRMNPASYESEPKKNILGSGFLKEKIPAYLGLFSELFNSTKRFKKAAVFSICAIFLTGTVALASRESLPGDSLYPVKIFSEDVRYSLAVSERSKAKLHVEFAAERISEIKAIFRKGKSSKDLDAAISRLKYNASLASDSIAKESRSAYDFAKEMNDVFSEQTNELKQVFKEAKKELEEMEEEAEKEINETDEKESGEKKDVLSIRLENIREDMKTLDETKKDTMQTIQEKKELIKSKMNKESIREADYKEFVEEADDVLDEKKELAKKTEASREIFSFEIFDGEIRKALDAAENGKFEEAKKLLKSAKEELEMMKLIIENSNTEKEDAGEESSNEVNGREAREEDLKESYLKNESDNADNFQKEGDRFEEENDSE